MIILLAAALSLLPLLRLLFYGAADTVTVTSEGKTVYSGPLDTDRVVELPGNTVVISGGHVTMTEADCPDGLCMRGGEATPAHPVVCLPNGVVVTVSGKEDNGLDGVAY